MQAGLHNVPYVDFQLKFNFLEKGFWDERLGYFQSTIQHEPSYKFFAANGVYLNPYHHPRMHSYSVTLESLEIYDVEELAWKVPPEEFSKVREEARVYFSQERNVRKEPRDRMIYSDDEISENIFGLVRLAVLAPDRIPPKF